MTCLLCLSPALLDQSFPRDLDEARRVGIALGEIQSHIESDLAHLVMTETLDVFVELFEWNRPDSVEVYPVLQIICSLLTQWALQPNERMVHLRIPGGVSYVLHPIPKGSDKEGLVDTWSAEVGKLYAVHQQECSRRGEYFIGVACDHAFAGEATNQYEDSADADAFPLVGPGTLGVLSDAYEPILPDGIRKVAVCFRDACRNCVALGASNVAQPPSGSHYKVSFPNAPRPWELDPNVDPIPKRFLKQLIPITGYSLEEIIYILTTGEKPRSRLRLYRYLSCG
jgi:hypothetical protein